MLKECLSRRPVLFVELCVSWACLRGGGVTFRVLTVGLLSVYGSGATQSDLICSYLPSAAKCTWMVLQSSRRPWHSSGGPAGPTNIASEMELLSPAILPSQPCVLDLT